MQESLGQNKAIWTDEWKNHSIEGEIRMWDFFGLRPWVMKFTPRFGKVIEAGCGLGRYVFLLNRFGIDIEGLDFSEDTINLLNTWKVENGFDVQFKIGDITKLPYDDNSIGGYLSFGVIEHFIEGPQKPLSEAFRTLRPGGIIIVTTPSKSWFYYYNILRSRIRNSVKYILGKKAIKPAFFQYWYSPKQLKKFVEDAGFIVTRYSGTDMLYTFHEFCRQNKINTENHKWLFKLAFKIERTFFKRWGAQSVVIAVKPAKIMHCFFCGELTTSDHSLTKFDVPICEKHSGEPNTNFYMKSAKNPAFCTFYQIQPDIIQPKEQICEISHQHYLTDELFENYGLSHPIHPNLLKNLKQNIKLANSCLLPVWRTRS